jgi:hypothetical protein
MLELRFYSELFSLILQVDWATKLREWLFIKFGFHFTVDNEKKDSATKSTALYWV